MDTIRLAFLGTGNIAPKHAKVLAPRQDVEIVGGCDIEEAPVHALWERTWGEGQAPDLPAFTDPAAMYEATRPDAVVICSPHTLHFEHAMQALEHGCHVLLEKPMVTDAGQAYALKAKAEATGRLVLVGFNTPFTPNFLFVRDLVRSGRFGRLELVSGWLSQPWIQAVAGTWRLDPALSGGGQAYDSGAHILNSLCWSVERHVAEVHAFIDCQGQAVDVNSSINIRFTDGPFAAIVISGSCPSSGSHMCFMFERGRVDIDGWSGSWIDVFEGGEKIDPGITGETLTPAENWIRAIRGEEAPRTGPENGVVHSELMDAIYTSARTGTPARPKPHTDPA